MKHKTFLELRDKKGSKINICVKMFRCTCPKFWLTELKHTTVSIELHTTLQCQLFDIYTDVAGRVFHQFVASEAERKRCIKAGVPQSNVSNSAAAAKELNTLKIYK